MSELPLVPERECGECKVCCSDLAIDSEQIQKTTRLTCCNHKTDGGCQVYQARPDVCRSFFCGWRMLPQLDETWRPNISGVLIKFQNNDIPEAYKGQHGIEFMLLDPAAIWREEVAMAIAASIASPMATFLTLAGIKGSLFPTVFLNDFMNEAVSTGDPVRIRARLFEVHAIMVIQPLREYKFRTTLQATASRQE